MGDADELSLYVFLKIFIFRALHGSVVCIVEIDSKKLQKKSFPDQPDLLNKTHAAPSRSVCNIHNLF